MGRAMSTGFVCRLVFFFFFTVSFTGLLCSLFFIPHLFFKKVPIFSLSCFSVGLVYKYIENIYMSNDRISSHHCLQVCGAFILKRWHAGGAWGGCQCHPVPRYPAVWKGAEEGAPRAPPGSGEGVACVCVGGAC